MITTDVIVKATVEGKNETIVRLWTRAGNQVNLRPTDPDTANQAAYAVEMINELLSN